jgi:predicted amidohydrolase
MIRAGVVQTRTGITPAANAAALSAAVADLAGQGADIIFTPEMSGVLDRDAKRLLAHGLDEANEPTLAALREVAAARGVLVAIGSLAVCRPDGRVANRSYLIGRDGAIVQTYDKLHLFDVDLGAGGRYRESATYAPGDAVRLADTDLGRLGFSICYDVRFPALYAALARAGALLIPVPAAFTRPTGEAHWHVLLRARAIETGAFIVAAAQTGRHEDGRETYGHSLVVDPWGRVLLDMGEEPGVALVELDPACVADARARIPSLGHSRPLPEAEVAP